MEESVLLALTDRKRKQLLHLNEAAELTRQMSEAMHRRDRQSMELLLNMRAEPLEALWKLERET